MQLSAPSLPFDPLPALPGGPALPPATGQLSAPGDFSRLLSSASDAPPVLGRLVPTAVPATLALGLVATQTPGGMGLAAANFQVAQPTLARALDVPTLAPGSGWLTATVAANHDTSGAISLLNLKGSDKAKSNDRDAGLHRAADRQTVPIGGGDLPTMPFVSDASAPVPPVSTAPMQAAVPMEGMTITPASLAGAADGALVDGAPTPPGLNLNSAPGRVSTGLAVNSLPIGLGGAPATAAAARLPMVLGARPTALASGDVTAGAVVTATPSNGRSTSSTSVRKIAEYPTGQPSEARSAPKFRVPSAVGDSSASVPLDVSASGLSGLVTAPGARVESQSTGQAVIDSSVRTATAFPARTGFPSGVAGDTTAARSSVPGVVVIPPGFGAPPSLAGAVTPDVGSSPARVGGTPLAPTNSGQLAAVNPAQVPTDPSLIGPEIVAHHSLNPTLENFAGAPIQVAEKSGSAEKTTQKKALVIDKELDGYRATAVGINAAKPVIPMSALAPSSSATSPVNEAPSFSVAPLSLEGLMKDSAGIPPELVHTAGRAVESAMAAVEHFANSDQKSVNLQFTVSGVDLAVRVELRGDNVHTTFRTDSPELRNALANEWQAVTNGPTGEGAHRFADPVFTTPSATSPSGSDFGAASQQRQSGSRQNQSFPPEFSGFRSSGLSADSSTESSVAKSPLPLPVSTSSRLNTFA